MLISTSDKMHFSSELGSFEINSTIHNNAVYIGSGEDQPGNDCWDQVVVGSNRQALTLISGHANFGAGQQPYNGISIANPVAGASSIRITPCNTVTNNQLVLYADDVPTLGGTTTSSRRLVYTTDIVPSSTTSLELASYRRTCAYANSLLNGVSGGATAMVQFWTLTRNATTGITFGMNSMSLSQSKSGGVGTDYLAATAPEWQASALYNSYANVVLYLGYPLDQLHITVMVKNKTSQNGYFRVGQSSMTSSVSPFTGQPNRAMLNLFRADSVNADEFVLLLRIERIV